MDVDLYKRMYTKFFEPSCIITKEMDVVDATRSFLELFGYTQDEMIGTKLNLLFPRDSYDIVEKILHKSNESLEWFAELPFEKKNGESFSESMGVFAVRDASEELVYCLAIQSGLRERDGINRFVEASEERYRELVDHINEIIFTLDMEGRFVTTGSYSVEPTRYRPDEGTVQDLMQDIKAEEIHKGFELPKGPEVPAEFRVMHRVGGEDSVRTLGTVGIKRDYSYKLPVTNLDPLSQGPISNFPDDRGSNADVEEETNESRSNSIISLIKEGIVAMDESGKLTDFNDAFLTMTGYTALEANQIPLHDYFAPDSREFLDRIFEDIIRDRTLVNYETRFIRKNGEIFPVSFDATLMEDDDGNVKGIIAVVRDMTEAMPDEVKLLRGGRLISEYSFVKIMLSSIRDGAIATDEFGQMIFFNGNVLSMLECTEDELVNRLVFDLFSDANRKEAVEIFEELDGSEETRDFSSVFQRLDGTALPVELVACSIKDRYDTKIGYLLVVSESVTKKTDQKEDRDGTTTTGISGGTGQHQDGTGTSNTDFLLEVDMKGTIINVNQQALKLLNYRGESLLKGKLGDYLLIGGSRLGGDIIKRFTTAKEANRSVEGTLLFKDQDPIPLILKFKVMKVQGNEEVKYLVVIESIPGNVPAGDRDFRL